MNTTDNYKLPLYEGADNPNLISGYNEAMRTLDTTVKENEVTLNAHAKNDEYVIEMTNKKAANGTAGQNKYGHVIITDKVVKTGELGFDPELGYVPSARLLSSVNNIAEQALLNTENLEQAKVLANGTLKVTG